MLEYEIEAERRVCLRPSLLWARVVTWQIIFVLVPRESYRPFLSDVFLQLLLLVFPLLLSLVRLVFLGRPKIMFGQMIIKKTFLSLAGLGFGLDLTLRDS